MVTLARQSGGIIMVRVVVRMGLAVSYYFSLPVVGVLEVVI